MSDMKRRVLVVDDHSALRCGLRSLIEGSDRYVIVGEASDGHSALLLAEETQPHIVTLDYSLPCLNGLDVVHRLRGFLPSVQILLYTLHDNEEFILQMMRAGVRAYVPKSDPGASVLAALDALSENRAHLSPAMSEALLNQVVIEKPQRSIGGLTLRERAVAQQIAEGRLNKQAAHALGVSIKTVETHRSNIMHKLNLRTTADLVRYAIRSNLILA